MLQTGVDKNTNPPKAIILLSGGLDSTTVLAIAQSQGFDLHAMSFAYGQRQAVELDAARSITKAHGINTHRIIDIDLRAFGGSALTSDIDVPKDRAMNQMATEIPITYVPARNTIFLSYALAWAEVIGAFDIFIGVNAVDYSGYPDCRPEFISAFQTMANLATAATTTQTGTFTIHTPLINLTKAQIIQRGTNLGVNYALTHSCYDPTNNLACGRCDSCLLRKEGFVQAEVIDPTRYKNN